MARRVSFTSLDLADRCLAQYEAKYIRKLKEPPSPPMIRGRWLHMVIDTYLQYLQDKQMIQNVDVIEEMVLLAGKIVAEVDSTEAFDDVLKAATYFANWYRHDFEAFIGSEIQLMRRLREPLNVGDERCPDCRVLPGDEHAPNCAKGDPRAAIDVVGFPDHVYLAKDQYGPLVVARDYKTGWDTTITASYQLQGKIMDWLLVHGLPQYDRFAYELFFPRHNIPSKRVEISTEDFRALELRMKLILARVDSQHQLRHEGNIDQAFPARVGSHCTYCFIATKCPSLRRARDNGLVVLTADEASAALEDTLVLKAALKQREESLKNYVRTCGPVAVSDSEGGFHKSDGVVLKNARGVIEAIGLEEALARNLLSIDGKKAATKKNQNDARLAPLYEPSEKVQWGIKTIDATKLVQGVDSEDEVGE